MSEPLQALAELTQEGWLVGGAVRDRLLGRHSTDYDVVVRGEARGLASRLARALDAHRFALSDQFGAWRVIARDRSWQVDLMPLLSETLAEDLARRDLTINAIAEPLAGGAHVDPLGGRDDLAAGRLRMASEHAFAEDPLRVLRLARLACELNFIAEGRTVAAARAAAPGLRRVAAERQFAELVRLLGARRALAGLKAMEDLGATNEVLPELGALRGVTQSSYHHLDVHDHTLLTLSETISIESDPAALFGELAAPVGELLAEPLSGGLTRGDALRFGALLHDIAKPQTRAVGPEGRITFVGHDAQGAGVARRRLKALRAGERLGDHVAALVRHHLRLGFLVHEAPLHRRSVYRYLHACDPVGVDVTLLSVADRLATRGQGAQAAIECHLTLARGVLGEALRWREDPPHPPVRGDELARALGLEPGPALGRLLAQLREASFVDGIESPADAVQRARVLLEDQPGATNPGAGGPAGAR